MIERRTASTFRSRSLSPVLVVMVESGALYSVSFLIVLVLFLNDSWAEYIVLDMVRMSEDSLYLLLKTLYYYKIIQIIVSRRRSSPRCAMGKILTSH